MNALEKQVLAFRMGSNGASEAEVYERLYEMDYREALSINAAENRYRRRLEVARAGEAQEAMTPEHIASNISEWRSMTDKERRDDDLPTVGDES